MFRNSIRLVPPQYVVQQNFTGVQESTRQHPAPAAINQPGGLVPGQEPAPSYPPVPSPPEFQSLGSPETTEKEIGTVSPMQVRLGSMVGKGCGVGSTAALVVGWARVVPLGIKHDLRWVGGLCALNGTSVGGRLAPSRSGSRARVDSGTSVARALLQLRKPTQAAFGALLAVLNS